MQKCVMQKCAGHDHSVLFFKILNIEQIILSYIDGTVMYVLFMSQTFIVQVFIHVSVLHIYLLFSCKPAQDAFQPEAFLPVC